MSKLKGVLYGLGIIVGACIGWFLLHRTDVQKDRQVTAQTLPAGDKAKVIVDERRHTFTTLTRTQTATGASGTVSTVTKFLSSGASIETKPDGTVVVTSRSWGTETSPWVGVSFDTELSARANAGLNLFYIQRWETGCGLSAEFTNAKTVRVFASESYNVYDNILVTATVDNHKAVGIGVALKF